MAQQLHRKTGGNGTAAFEVWAWCGLWDLAGEKGLPVVWVVGPGGGERVAHGVACGTWWGRK
eukprot:54247-Chlamydomonas_euryale.AAC.1